MSMQPKPSRNISQSGISAGIAFWFAAAVTLIVFLTAIFTPVFIVDSWSYFELSKKIFTDFYRINTLRQYEIHTLYSNAFPPLWPILLAAFHRALDLGIYSGTVLNFAVCLGLLAALIRLFRNLDLPGWIGAACYLCILGLQPFESEALGAKSIPLALMLIVFTLPVIVRDPITKSRAVLGGLLMGLACVDRFDSLALACVIGLVIAFRTYQLEHRFLSGAALAALYFATLVVVISPWAAYGMSKFGKPFASPDTRQAALAHGGYTMDYYATPPVVDFPHHLGKWTAGLLFYKAPKIAFAFCETVQSSAFPILLAVVLVIWVGSRRPSFSSAAARFVVLALIFVPLMLFPAALSGFKDNRYHSGPLLLLIAVLFVVLISLTPDAWGSWRATLLLVVTALLIPGPMIVEAMISGQGELRRPSARALLTPTPEMLQLTDAIRRDSAGAPHRLVMTTGELATARYGALTGEQSAFMPGIKNGTFADFAREWHVTHVYNPPAKSWTEGNPYNDPQDVMTVIRTGGTELIPLDMPGLYRIRLTTKEPAR